MVSPDVGERASENFPDVLEPIKGRSTSMAIHEICISPAGVEFRMP